MLRLAFDFIITWRETRTRPNAYELSKQGILVQGIVMERECSRMIINVEQELWSLRKR